jgi:RHS repeat-associated protein
MTQPYETLTRYAYDRNDHLTLVIDPNGNPTQYRYDDFGHLAESLSPDTLTTSHRYDEAGNLIQRTDARGTLLSYTYDSLNRLKGIRFPDPSQDVTYIYDSPSVSYGIGWLTGRIDPSGSYTYHYDTQGNLTKEEKEIGSISYATQYAYNKDNILTSITYPSGRRITYTPDQTGKITEIETNLNGNSKPLARGISYLPYGGITGLTYGNDLSLSQGYDLQYRTAFIVTGSLLNRTYGYDPNGNIISMTDLIEPKATPPHEKAEIYTYEPGTNRLANITGDSSIAFTYDSKGNIIQENNRVYTYDPSNQLIKVEEGTTTLAEYVYNASGQRIKKILPTETRIFHYDLQGHLITETNQAGQTLAEYVYLGDQLLAMIRPGEKVFYFHNDHLGTPQILTDENRNIAWKAAYTSFGRAQVSIEAIENPFRFPGQYYDRETGLHYNYHRYYNPRTGRYITPDPIGLGGGINLFTYVAGNPINLTDPLGLHGPGYIAPGSRPCISTGTCHYGAKNPKGSQPSGIWSGAGGNVGGILLSGGVYTGIYRVTSWDTGQSCWIMTTCSGTGLGLTGSLAAESIWIWNAYSSNDLAGLTEGAIVSGGKGIVAAGGSYSAGGCGNPVTGPISNPSASTAVTFGAGVGGGAGYLIGGCETTVLSCN